MSISYSTALSEVISRHTYQAVYTAIANYLQDRVDSNDRESEDVRSAYSVRYLGCVGVDQQDRTRHLTDEMNDDDCAIIHELFGCGIGYTDPALMVAQCLADAKRTYAANHLDKTVYKYANVWRRDAA